MPARVIPKKGTKYEAKTSLKNHSKKRNINPQRRFNKFIIKLVGHSLPWLAPSTRKIISREAHTGARVAVAKQIHVLAISRPPETRSFSGARAGLAVKLGEIAP